MTTKEANEKFVKGKEGLTDGELCALLNLYKELIQAVFYLDSDFSLFKKELNRRYELLHSFAESRKR